jgi:maleamate amidohydrolase
MFQMSERLWDRFLTEQDRRAVATAADRRVGFGQRPALLLVDLYRWVFGDKPEPLLDAIKSWPGSCGLAAWQALPHIQRLLESARAARIPVVHVTGLDRAGMTIWIDAIHPEIVSGATGSVAGLAHEQLDRRYDIVEQVAPREGEVVLRKSAPSAFWGTPLVGHLTHLGTDTLIVAGEATSGCVRATVVDAASHRYRVTVPEECVFDRHEATHAINLFDMHQKYADVLPLNDVLELIDGVRSEPGTSRPHAPASDADPAVRGRRPN